MQIPSLQKIEAQVKAYCATHTPVNDFDSEYNQHEREFLQLRSKWDKEVDKCPACHGGKCNCQENPLYKTLYLDVIMVAHAKLMEEWREVRKVGDAIHDHYLALLISARNAKLSIKTQRQRHGEQR